MEDISEKAKSIFDRYNNLVEAKKKLERDDYVILGGFWTEEKGFEPDVEYGTTEMTVRWRQERHEHLKKLITELEVEFAGFVERLNKKYENS